jgi:hypothetical protein
VTNEKPGAKRPSSFVGTLGNLSIGLPSEFPPFVNDPHSGQEIAPRVGSFSLRNSLKNNDIKTGRSPKGVAMRDEHQLSLARETSNGHWRMV